jgi:hypothetical protein
VSEFQDKEKDFTVKVTIALDGYGNPDKERKKMLNSVTNILKLYFDDNVTIRYNGRVWEPE